MRDSNEDIEAANRRRIELNHDLRNLLGAITGGLRLLERSPSVERTETIITMMKDSTARLTELIESALVFDQKLPDELSQ